ncbi:uncharacterized protein BYT42DRAFT_500540 [Radiomyces spectabilis]|uniref:uncharacterized protein n=1 Tax=Radiomyces spectabilis TaxID=64574 RepID=UPI00221E5909|nr:uncharacterized protein BYT42DRAFT_500540 [Radiomyces spectabilis]KAI8372965.1 hypothetical protein BYT42DRAFT_500540 [Radiomyces spectabilis]
MAFVQSADERYAEAFVEWINSFDHLPYTCEHISQLSDGVLLRDILLDIDPKWFRSMHSVDMGDNWVFKVNNLKKMYKLISRYYEEVFSQGLQTLPAVNLTAIAKETDTKEILKLCQRILYLAIQSTKTEKYINKIQRLSQPSQHALMVSIEQVRSLTCSLVNMKPLLWVCLTGG